MDRPGGRRLGDRELVIVGGIPREVFDIKVDATILGGRVLFERS